MNRTFAYLNFIGVLALVALCSIQWKTNRRLNLRGIELETIRLEQSTTIEKQARQIAGDAAALDDFRQRLSLAESELKDVQTKLTATTAERDRLKSTLGQWITAVAERDAALKRAAEQIQQLSAARNAAIQRFNDLANKYNAMVNGANHEQAQQ